MRQKITEELVDQMEVLYNKGLDTRQIANELSCGQATVCRHLIKRGYDLQKRYREATKQRYELAERLYNEGWTVEKAAKEAVISRKRFSHYLHEKGYQPVNTSKKYTQNDQFFKVIDTEEKAYWLGFLYADGCISERIQYEHVVSLYCDLCLQSRDVQHLEKFKKAIEGTGRIKEKAAKVDGKEYSSHRFAVYSTEMCRDLIRLGCTPRKSFTLTFPSEEQVPNHLIHHFVRGYVDGDGSIMFHSSKKYGRVSVLGTEAFLSEMIKRMGWREVSIRGCNYADDPMKQIDYGKREDSTQILHQLYSEATVYLDRKYEKYQEIIAVLEGDL